MLSIFIMLFVFSGIGHAASNKTIHVNMNGGNVSVTQVPIMKDGQIIEMEIPSFIYIDRTLVPLRFVAESYGAKVGWDQKTQMATVIHGEKEINLTINSDVATLNTEKKLLDKNSIPKLVTFANQDTRTMVPLAFMSEILGYEVGWDDKANAAYINSKNEVEPNTKPEEPKEYPNGEVETIDLSNKVMNITHGLVDGKEAIIIQGTKNVKINIMKLNNPERIVVDLVDSTLQGSTFYNYDYNLGFIKGVRASQFSPDNNYKPNDKIVRVVLDTKEGTLDPNVKIDTYEDKIFIFPEKSFWQNMSYTGEGKDRTITINNLTETSYSINYDPTPKTMEITIPTDNVELEENMVDIKDPLINQIKVIKDPIETRVYIQFKSSIEYTLLSNERDNKVMLQIRKDSNVKSGDRLIVIDPGHGGKQPGTSSPNNVKEKDVNLTISLKAEEALKKQGYNVLMTRNADTTLGLSERANVANENFADI